MKALKEKRISLRSLWRMGLVVLSVLALSFAACGNSEGGEPTDPGPNTPPPPAKGTAIPTEMIILTPPSDPLGFAHEGQNVSLEGISARIIYSDSTSKIVGKDDLTVQPKVYTTGGTYGIYYADNGVIVGQSSPATPSFFGAERRLVDISVTGYITRADAKYAPLVYDVDEVPNFKAPGLEIWGWYSSNNAQGPVYSPGNNTERDWYPIPIDFRPEIPQYSWAWVWNQPTTTGSWDGAYDSPGVLLSIGSYGNIYSYKTQEVPGQYVPNQLLGRRIPIQQLKLVTGIKWVSDLDWTNRQTWVFYDDPTLIGTEATKEKWVDVVLKTAGAKFQLIYDFDESKPSDPYVIDDLEYLNRTRLYYGGEGTWADGIKISLWDAKGTGRYNTFRPYGEVTSNLISYIPAKAYAINQVQSATDIEYLGGWAEWAALADPKIKVNYRGVDTEARSIPVYNTINALLDVSIAEAGATQVYMRGSNYVYGPPEAMFDFLGRLVVKAKYTQRGQTVEREKNIVESIAEGTTRGSIEYDKNTAFRYPTGNLLKMPTLYSSNIFNPLSAVDVELVRGVLDFASYPVDDPLNVFGGITQTPITEVQATSQLTAASSAGFARTPPRLVGAVVAYRAWAGNPEATRLARSNKLINVAPVGWTYDPDL